MKTFYTHDQIKERWPCIVPGIEEPSQRHFHFRPARPANLLVTLDRETGEVNVSAGTIGPLTWDPYTMVIHCAKSSRDSVHNIQQVGAECVIALPGQDINYQTWITALCVPRGVNEAKVARLTLLPSQLVEPPSIAECRVNLECVIEYFREQHSHYVAFLRVLGATIDEDLLSMSQEEAMRQYPTWEVDDIDNEWGGSVERLGTLGEFLPTPSVRPKRGWGRSFEEWVADLHTTDQLSAKEYETVQSWLSEWDAAYGCAQQPGTCAPAPSSDWGADRDALGPQAKAEGRTALKDKITRLCQLVAWDEMEELHRLLSSG